MKYRITYFAPYSFANFTCVATSLEDGRRQKEAFNRAEGYSIPNREIKTETCK